MERAIAVRSNICSHRFVHLANHDRVDVHGCEDQTRECPLYAEHGPARDLVAAGHAEDAWCVATPWFGAQHAEPRVAVAAPRVAVAAPAKGESEEKGASIKGCLFLVRAGSRIRPRSGWIGEGKKGRNLHGTVDTYIQRRTPSRSPYSPSGRTQTHVDADAEEPSPSGAP